MSVVLMSDLLSRKIFSLAASKLCRKTLEMLEKSAIIDNC